MKTRNKRNYLEQSGITLIALVVTIVVLLILAGVSKPVTNPYDPNGWTMAYVCNNGIWNDTPLISANGDTIPEGTQIVAKFYATGEKITPPQANYRRNNTNTFRR